MAKIRKRSKHLVVQDNPFRKKEVPPPITPTNTKPTGDADNSSWRPEQNATRHLYDKREIKSEDFKKEPHLNISFKGEGTMKELKVTFWGFIESLSENFSTNFNQVDKIGSPEPIHQYSGTSKEINISWKAYEDDYEDLSARIEILKELVYPTIDDSGIPTQPPVLTMMYGPLREEYAKNPASIEDRDKSPLPRKNKEIFGYITSLGIDYSSQEMGYAVEVDDDGNYDVGTLLDEDDEAPIPLTVRPREVSISVNFKQINRGITGTFK